jgi:hypothetical protein
VTGSVRFSVVLTVLAMGAAGVVAVAPPQATAGTPVSLVYSGNHGLDEGYTRFATATGTTVEKATGTLPTDLSSFRCVVLAVNGLAFDAGQVAALDAYLAGGGHVLALGEHLGFNATTVMPALARGLGFDVTWGPDGGTSVTNHIVASSLTTGVRTVHYLATGTFTSHTLLPLVWSPAGQTVVAAGSVGNGVFALSGDSNAFSDVTGTPYVDADNGNLAHDLCNSPARFAKPAISIGSGTFVAASDRTHVVVPLTLSAPRATPFTVGVASHDGSAVAGRDYVAVDRVVHFAPDQVSASVDVTLRGRHDSATFTRAFTLGLSGASGDVNLAFSEGTIDIVNDPALTGLSVADVDVVEGDSARHLVAVTVQLAEPSATTVTANWATVDGTAHAPKSYAAKSGTLTIPAGATSAKVRVPIRANVAPEMPKSFSIMLSGVVGAAVDKGTGTVTIIDDDGI